jgi:hypothetical protein
MSSDVRDLLRDAATVPSTGADVAGAWRRGRRLRMQRRALSGLAIVAIVALGSVVVANVLPGKDHTTPVAPGPLPGRVCSAVSFATNDIPTWAESAKPPRTIPHVLSADGNVVAFLFGDPLWAALPNDTHNKVLWIVRQPRGGQPLKITATLPGSDVAPVHLSLPANSSPGEIYPSTVNVPAPGCWHLTLAWNGHHSAIDLGYGSVVPKKPEGTTTVPMSAPAGPTTCPTKFLTVLLGPPNGTAGHMNYEISFRNDSASACVMSGYPGVSFLDGSGRQIGVPAQRNSIPHNPVTLAPGATAYAHLAVTDPSVLAGCPAVPAHQIRIYPPNETEPVDIAAGGIAVCARTPGSSIDPVLDHSVG